MFPVLLPLLAQANTLLSRLTAARATKLDNLDAAISTISPIASVQYGTISMAGSALSATATIATVGSKAVLHLLGTNRNSVASSVGAGEVQITLTNPTTVTATRWEGGGIVWASFCVVNYK